MRYRHNVTVKKSIYKCFREIKKIGFVFEKLNNFSKVRINYSQCKGQMKAQFDEVKKACAVEL